MDTITSIWTEKYRPKVFADIKGQEEIVAKLSAFVSQRNIPHLLFAGPAGGGKSTLAPGLARGFFGENYCDNFLEVNSSDERGIDVVRNKVKDFARTKAIGNVPFKIIFLDECDALTKEAQQALRRTMENYTSTCRFILAANYSSKIIDPIQSRCAVFRFRPLSNNNILSLIDRVVVEEGLSVDEKAREALVKAADGDCRRVNNILQSCAAISKTITSDDIYSLASMAESKDVKDIILAAVKGDFLTARNKLLDVMLRYGLSGLDLVKQIQSEVWNTELEGRKKVVLIDKCGEAEFRMVEGSDEFIQLEALLAQFVLAGSG